MRFILFFIPLFIGNILTVFSQANAGPDKYICGDSTSMQAEDPSPMIGHWSVVSGTGLFEDPFLFNTAVTYISEGENVYK